MRIDQAGANDVSLAVDDLVVGGGLYRCWRDGCNAAVVNQDIGRCVVAGGGVDDAAAAKEESRHG